MARKSYVRPLSPCADHADWSQWYDMRDGTNRKWRVCRACGKREIAPMTVI